MLAAIGGISLLFSCMSQRGYTGVVQTIENGKDGYTAEMKDARGQTFDALFSIPRMEKNYKRLKPGDRVQLSGDTIHLNERTRVLVKTVKENP